MTNANKIALLKLYDELGGILEAEGLLAPDGDESAAGPVTPEMAAAMDEAADLPPGTIVPVGTGNVRSVMRPIGQRPEAPAAAPSPRPPAPALSTLGEPPAPSPIVGVCDATKGCGTLIADDNRDARGKLICPRCQKVQAA